ncbi:MAG TPA: hypothetical protein VJN95_00980 [Gemmatimonadales bacterium]|nr:hypothetical protein [Gemmatimonadales bacterium]
MRLMDRWPTTLVVASLLLGSGVCRLSAQEEWAAADRQTRRLAPVSFTKIPQKITEELERRRCLIPQAGDDTIPHSVVKGSFFRAGQTDYAALCSRARASTIVVIWGGPSDCPDEMEVRQDKSYLLKGSDGVIRYLRRIESIVPKRIKALFDRYGGDPPPPLSHDGINDRFTGKGSVIRYCYDGKWRELTGEQ